MAALAARGARRFCRGPRACLAPFFRACSNRAMAARIWTVPNLVTLARIAAAPGIALAFWVFERPLADQVALALFMSAALTDFLDGWLARRLGQVSELGKMLDPIADKAMVFVGLGAVLAFARGPYPVELLLPAAVILVREALVSGLREFLGDVKLAVTRLAKWKTTVQMVAIGVLLSVHVIAVGEGELVQRHIERGEQFILASELVELFGLYLLWIAAVLTAITGVDYFRKGVAHISAMEE
ncbi:MAG: CDP-diacylglycerol--glycerol-3-phosphate 3-phosphatidyltransferase [Pseudomonadota bacterium]